MARANCFILIVLALTGCCGPVRGLYPPVDSDRALDVYAYNNHWHTGFVLQRDQLSPTLQKYLARFSTAKFVELGWGDEAFYRAPKGTSGLALQAMFVSHGSVLHVAGFDESPETHYRELAVELYRIHVSGAGYERLQNYLEKTFATSSAGDSIALQPGLYGVSYFYAARGKYFILHSCNNWTADGVRATGFPIAPAYAQTAANVGWQIRNFGRKYQSDLLTIDQ